MSLCLKEPDSFVVDALHPAANFEERVLDVAPSMLIMHYTGMSSAEAAIAWLARDDSKVSCHYVIDEDGRVTQMVAERARAWHAGQSFWAGETDINSVSIGIEIQNPGHEDGYHDYLDKQMTAVLALSQDIVARHKIAPERVLGHSDVAPSRKIDPGEKFNWAWLHAHGVGHWVEPDPVGVLIGDISHGQIENPIARAQSLLARYGYGIEATGRNDKQSRPVVMAFQRHFRPQRVNGLIDSSTVVTLERLVDALPEALVG